MLQNKWILLTYSRHQQYERDICCCWLRGVIIVLRHERRKGWLYCTAMYGINIPKSPNFLSQCDALFLLSATRRNNRTEQPEITALSTSIRIVYCTVRYLRVVAAVFYKNPVFYELLLPFSTRNDKRCRVLQTVPNCIHLQGQGVLPVVLLVVSFFVPDCC